MKVAVSSLGESLDSQVNPRFGRSEIFVIIDTADDRYRVLQNSSVRSSGGAGVETVSLLADQGIDAVVSGYIGPHAQRALDARGIAAYSVASGTVAEVVARLKAGTLPLHPRTEGKGGVI